MNIQTMAVADGVLPVCGIAVFAILFVTIHASLKRSQMFQERSVTVLSACVSLLCVIGMYQTFVTPETSQNVSESNGHSGVFFLLVPYAALGIALLMMLLLIFLARLVGGDKAKQHTKNAFPIDPLSSSKHMKEQVPSPLEWPMNLNREQKPKIHINADYLNQTLRNINSIEQMRPNPKPSDSRGIRHER